MTAKGRRRAGRGWRQPLIPARLRRERGRGALPLLLFAEVG